MSRVHSAEKNNPVNCFLRGGQGGEPCRADTFIANWSRQRRVESSRASEPEVSKNIANESNCEMSDCFL